MTGFDPLDHPRDALGRFEPQTGPGGPTELGAPEVGQSPPSVTALFTDLVGQGEAPAPTLVYCMWELLDHNRPDDEAEQAHQAAALVDEFAGTIDPTDTTFVHGRPVDWLGLPVAEYESLRRTDGNTVAMLAALNRAINDEEYQFRPTKVAQTLVELVRRWRTSP